MDTGDDHELRDLRARAYGPRPDIGADERAVRRLAELERLRRGDASSPGEVAGVDARPEAGPGANGAAAVDVTASEGDAGPGVPTESLAPGEPVPDPNPWRVSRRVGAVWAGSVLVAIVASALSSVALAPPGPLVAGAAHEATLAADPSFEPSSLGGGTGFTPFAGLRSSVESFDQREGPPVMCLNVFVSGLDDVEPSQYSGPLESNCGTSAFPPVATMLVDETYPAALRARFADGTSLQFVVHDDTVEVYSAKG
ncbi:hypothetical protein [Microbacterium gorillae]|uniref:hypothetical protein n=1 Tax=Microbacterium gorillae TaxID=1231063 RepID=UPI00059099E9|nr:hypothetical protein [Microbacterium gorillae]